eukprot:10558953-Heterocapsa_arctica.AAC.1
MQKKIDELTFKINNAGPKPEPAEVDDGVEVGKLQTALAGVTAAFGADSDFATGILQKLEQDKRLRVEARPSGSQTVSAQRNVAR